MSMARTATMISGAIAAKSSSSCFAPKTPRRYDGIRFGSWAKRK